VTRRLPHFGQDSGLSILTGLAQPVLSRNVL
jgi:hypothetical protein